MAQEDATDKELQQLKNDGKCEKKRARSRDRSRDRCRSRESDTQPSSSDSDSSSRSRSRSSSSSSDSEEERRRRRRRRKKRKREKEEKERAKEKRRQKKLDKQKDEKKRKKKQKADRHKTGPVTAWGKFGLIRETDLWTKRPEFSAWLNEVKKVNLETVPNWEEKALFKEYMEDFNTATLPSKKYYNIDRYHHQKLMKKYEKGMKAMMPKERTDFNDEEQRRQELKVQRENEKEAEIETIKKSMRPAMAKAMRDQAQLREEMQYKYRLGNFEAAASIQRRLEPDTSFPSSAV